MATTTYIGKVKVGENYIPIGTAMFGTCTPGLNPVDDNENTAGAITKEVYLPGYDNPTDGLLIYVRFDAGNEIDATQPNTNMYLRVNGGVNAILSSVPVIGNAVCAAGDIVAFVYESGENNSSHWRVAYGSLRGKVEELNSTVSTLQGNLSGLTGAMHFKGTVDTFPPTNNTYESGDVILGPDNKEYVYNGTTWIELGDEGSYMLSSAYNDNTSITYITFAPNSETRNPALSIGTGIQGIVSSGNVVTGMTDITNADQDPPVVLTGATNATFNIPAGTTFNISGGVLTLTPIAASTISAVDAEHLSSKKLVTTPVYFDPGSHPTFTQPTTVNNIVTKKQQQNAGG